MTDRLDSPHDELTEAPPREWLPNEHEHGDGAPTIEAEPASTDREPSHRSRTIAPNM